jgi:CRP-like cAMP-binding protein
VDYAPGDLASAEGDEAFLLVLDGSASVRAGQTEVAHLDRGATFGEGRVLGGGRPLSLVARTDLAVVSFPAPMIGALGERFPKMKKLLEAVLAAREREAAAKLPG